MRGFYESCNRHMIRLARAHMSNSRPLYSAISEKLTNSLSPSVLLVQDESHMHRGHAGVHGATTHETHFSVEIVSDSFKGLNRIARQRLVNSVLKDEFEKGLHALALNCKAPEEL